jgi:uncharacterized protein YneF (UPF0154 family)
MTFLQIIIVGLVMFLVGFVIGTHVAAYILSKPKENKPFNPYEP